MNKVNAMINDIAISVPEGTTILDAAKELDMGIPTLCYVNWEEFNMKHKEGSCRICVVEIEGRYNLAPACCTPVAEGMVINTNNPRVLQARRTVLQLLLSDHPKDCLSCAKAGDCDLQHLAEEFQVFDNRYEGEQTRHPIERSSGAISRDPNKCVLCRRCDTACNTLQTVGVLTPTERGFHAVVDTAMHKPLLETKCTFCGQCISVCPTGALTSINYNEEILNAIYDPKKIVVAQTAPAVRVAIGELFGGEPGALTTGKMVAALKKLHFDFVFDTNFAADLTIMEEANELVDRLNSGGPLPILTSCCPAWINFLELQFNDMLAIPSTSKSPQQMFGAVAKHYWAKKMGYNPEDVVVVSIMPCVAKKYECHREEMKQEGIPDVDYVMTTRELATLLKESGIRLDNLQEREFDNPLGESTGAAVIFGTAGGVLEAALRTAAEIVTGTPLPSVDFTDVRGLTGVREASVQVGDQELLVAQASGLGNVRKLLNAVRKGNKTYHAIEVMACPGGCINGGGQPYIHGDTSIITKRAEGLYLSDKMKKIRKSHENPAIKALYNDWLEKPGSEKAHRFLHTKYFTRHE